MAAVRITPEQRMVAMKLADATDTTATKAALGSGKEDVVSALFVVCCGLSGSTVKVSICEGLVGVSVGVRDIEMCVFAESPSTFTWIIVSLIDQMTSFTKKEMEFTSFYCKVHINIHVSTITYSKTCYSL